MIFIAISVVKYIVVQQTVYSGYWANMEKSEHSDVVRKNS